MTSKVSYTSASIAPASQNGTTGLWAICWLWFRLEEPKQKKTVHKNIKTAKCLWEKRIMWCLEFMRGKTDSCRNSREKLMTVESQWVKVLSIWWDVRVFIQPSITRWPLWKSWTMSQTVSLSSDANTQDSFFWSDTHIQPSTESHLHTCFLCVSRTHWCVGGVGWMLSGIEVHNKLQLILQRTSRSEKQRERGPKQKMSVTVLTTTRPHSYPVPVIIVMSTVKVMETWLDSAWSQHCWVY